MEDLSLHILDIVENSVTAGAKQVNISIIKDSQRDIMEMIIVDNGRGMDHKMLKNVRDPFVTTRTTRRVGLGISLLERSTVDADGSFDIKSEPGKGTEIKATFKISHIDCKPIGDIGSTMISLILGNPDVDFTYISNFDGEETILNTREIKDELDGVCITDPAVLKLIRDMFTQVV